MARAMDVRAKHEAEEATQEELDAAQRDYDRATDLLWGAVTPAEPPADACKCDAPVCRSGWPNPFLIYPAERETEAG